MTITLMPHQIDARDFLSKQGGVLLAHEMGTGKTFSGISAMENCEPKGPRLISAPSVMMYAWEAELARLAPTKLCLVLDSSTSQYLGDGRMWDYVIASHDLPGRNADVKRQLMRPHWDRMLVDEAHGMKGFDSLRSRAWLTSSTALATRVQGTPWLLTGTPTPNHAGELWPLIKGTNPERIDDQTYEQFEEQYCRFKMQKRAPNEEPVRVVAGTRMGQVPVLRENLSGWWHRKTKAEVMPDLPQKVLRVVPVDVGKLDAGLEELMESAEGVKLAEAIAENDMTLGALVDEDSMSRYRRLMALAKAKMAAEYVNALVDGGTEGVLVWFWHTAAMSLFEKHCAHPLVRIDGSDSPKSKFAKSQQFQNPLGQKVAVLQLDAAGKGITMTKADREVFVETFWAPDKNAQAIDRAHRYGLKHSLLIDFLAVRDSLDYVVMETAERKTRETMSLLENVQ